MRLLRDFLPSLLLLTAKAVSAASWSFEDGSVAISGKGTGSEVAFKDKLSPDKPLAESVPLGSTDSLRVSITTTNGKKPRRPHQAFLTLRDDESGLEESWPLAVKETGKGKLDLTHNNIPAQLLVSSSPLKAYLTIASFGTSAPYKAHAFDLQITHDPNVPPPSVEKPLRYGALPEIHHQFRADPRSPPKIITLLFLGAVLACLPVLFIVWGALGANVNHLSKAMQTAPIAHALFFGSVVAMEGVFFMYYTAWNLFQTLPVAGAVAAVGFVSGTKALSEVQGRRLAGMR